MRAARRIRTSATSAITPMTAVATISTHGSADGTRAVYAVGTSVSRSLGRRARLVQAAAVVEGEVTAALMDQHLRT